MYSIIERYINKLTKEDMNKFAINKGINLSETELDFTYNFIKKNWYNIIKNPSIFNIDNYKDKYEEDNFIKIKKLFLEYFKKYANYL